jgi:enoyl-CoA hydratase
MTQEHTDITLTAQDGILVVTINRPERRNALGYAQSLAMSKAFDILESDPSLSCAVLTGAGGHFCSGMDLKQFADGRRPEVAGTGFGGLTERQCSKPIIAAVEGFALAGGFELVLACDLVVASDTAVFGLPEVRRGLVAGSGGVLRLGAKIPPVQALEYLLTGQSFTAQQAMTYGMLNRLVPAGEALVQAMALAQTIAANAPLAIGAIKSILNHAGDWPQANRWREQALIVDPVLASNDAVEGARAFAEKRQPVWQGC